MLILHRFQKVKASSERSLRTNPSSWKGFRSILKTYRDIFLISRLLFEKMNFLHQQNAIASQMTAKMQDISMKSEPPECQNSIFSKSPQMFPDGVKWVWGWSPGLKECISSF